MPIDPVSLGTSTGLSVDGATKIFNMLHSGQDNMTANPGGGQSKATQITTINARFTTVGTNGDSAMLPPAIAGQAFVKNDGNHNMALYPQVGEKLNGTKNGSFTLNAQQCMMVVCFGTKGEWHTLASA